MAKVIDQEECWSQLAASSLLQGNLQVAELSYQRIKDLEKLGFTYLITGASEKLSKLVKISQLRGDVQSEYTYSVTSRLVEEQVKILIDSNLRKFNIKTKLE